MADYVHPEVLISCDWVEQNRSKTDKIRIVESDEDLLLYESGHVPGAVKLDWVSDLQDAVVSDYVGREEVRADLCRARYLERDNGRVLR